MSSPIVSINTIQIYEENGVAIHAHQNKATLTVREHSTRRDMVVISIGDCHKYTVCASDIITAIKNSQNAHKSIV